MARVPLKVSGLVTGETSRPVRQFNREFGSQQIPGDASNEPDEKPTSGSVVNISVHLLDDSPSQYRMIYPAEEIDSLAQTLMVGQIEPIRVRQKLDGRYEIIAGHRRTRAAKAVGIEHLSAIVVEIDDRRAAIEVILSNESQEQVGDFERAIGYQRLKELGFKQTEIADVLGVNRSLVTNRLKFLSFPIEVLKMLKLHPRALSHHSVPQLLNILDETPELLNDLVEGIAHVGMGEWTPATLFAALRQKQSNATQSEERRTKPLAITDRESLPLLTLRPKPNGRIEIQLAPGRNQEVFLRKLAQLMREDVEKSNPVLFTEDSKIPATP